jgi:hypothetical protein
MWDKVFFETRADYFDGTLHGIKAQYPHNIFANRYNNSKYKE